MAVSTYTGLKASLALWLRRADLTAVIPDFITLAESQMNRRLRVAAMIGRNTDPLASEYSAVPTDFAGVRTLDLETNPITHLQFVTPDELNKLKATIHQAPGKPTHYSIVGTSIHLSPAPDGTYAASLTYWQTIPPLASNATNWLLTKHPDAYLYGALVQSAPYLRADERLVTWTRLFIQALDDIEADDQRASFGAAPSMRVRRIG